MCRRGNRPGRLVGRCAESAYGIRLVCFSEKLLFIGVLGTLSLSPSHGDRYTFSLYIFRADTLCLSLIDYLMLCFDTNVHIPWIIHRRREVSNIGGDRSSPGGLGGGSPPVGSRKFCKKCLQFAYFHAYQICKKQLNRAIPRAIARNEMRVVPTGRPNRLRHLEVG